MNCLMVSHFHKDFQLNKWKCAQVLKSEILLPRCSPFELISVCDAAANGMVW